MELFLLVCLLVCALCAGICIGLVAGLHAEEHADKSSASAPSTHSRSLSDEEWKEFRRRQREMQNFFNYSGDTMPPAEED